MDIQISCLLLVALVLCCHAEHACEHGEYIRHSGECRRWYRCVWGRLIEMPACGQGLVFSMKLLTCIWEDDSRNDCLSVPTKTSCFNRTCSKCIPETVTLDLDKGSIEGSLPQGFTFLQTPTPQMNGKPCSLQAFLKVNFKRPGTAECLDLLRIDLNIGKERRDHMFNFGDSKTNNGRGGDSSTQENDAEIDYFSSSVAVHGSDKCNRVALKNITNAATTGVSKLFVWIGNQYVRVKYDAGEDVEVCHDKCLFLTCWTKGQGRPYQRRRISCI